MVGVLGGILMEIKRLLRTVFLLWNLLAGKVGAMGIGGPIESRCKLNIQLHIYLM